MRGNMYKKGRGKERKGGWNEGSKVRGRKEGVQRWRRE
jgi:hypothetical protein